MVYCLDLPGRSVIGADAHQAVGEEVRRLNWTRVLLVSDPYQQQEGRTAEIQQLLEKAQVSTSVYTEVTGEPDTEMVDAGLEQFKKDRCDGVVTLGGGSPMDTAKTIAVMAVNEGPVKKFMALNAVEKPGVGVIAIPTTAGTGSETTVAVVIADKKSKIKMSGRDRAFVPGVALVDYKLTMTMPPALTAAVGVDALTHAIEAYVSRQANESTDPYALSAIRLIWRSIRRGVWANRKLVIVVPRSELTVRTSLATLPTNVMMASVIWGTSWALCTSRIGRPDHHRRVGQPGTAPGPAVEDQGGVSLLWKPVQPRATSAACRKER